MRKTLIVIDLQNDFVTGPLGTEEARAIIPNVKKKIAEYECRGDEIIFTRDMHFKDYLNTNEGKHLPIKHCIINSDGWHIVDDIDNPHANRMVYKDTFGYTGWNQFEFSEIEIVGLCTDICVITNVLILKTIHHEIDITVDASCCAGTTPENHKAALAVMKACQINVINE